MMSPVVAFDTQIAAYIINAALRSQSLQDISAALTSEELSVHAPTGSVAALVR